MKLIAVEEKKQIKEIERLANIIWREHYKSILSDQQIEYMLKNFQSEKVMAAQMNDGYTYFLINDCENIGYISYKITENTIFLSKIYILAEHRKKGHGKAVLEVLKKICVTEKYEKIWLTVNQHNKNTIEAYEKMGFVKDGSQIADIGDGFFMDDYIYVYIP